MQKTIWLAYNTDGDVVVDPDNAADALSSLVDNYGISEGVRCIQIDLTLPEIKTAILSAVIPDTDGPVTITVQG